MSEARLQRTISLLAERVRHIEGQEWYKVFFGDPNGSVYGQFGIFCIDYENWVLYANDSEGGGNSWSRLCCPASDYDHNDLAGIQGGAADDYYHLTLAQHTPTRGDIYYGDATPEMALLPVGAANEVLTNDGTDVFWSAGAVDLTAGFDLTVEAASLVNQDLTTDASVTFADVFVPDGGTFGINGAELLTVNAAGTFAFSGITGIAVEDGDWFGIAGNELLTVNAGGTFAFSGITGIAVEDGDWFGIAGNELLTVNAAGTFAFSGILGITVEDDDWIGFDAAAGRIEFDSSPAPDMLLFADCLVRTEQNIDVGASGCTGLDYRTTTVADNDTWIMARDGGLGIGLVHVYCSSGGSSCLFLINNNTVQIIMQTANNRFTVTQGTDGFSNVYHTGGVLTIENKRGSNRTYRVGYFTIGPT